MDAPPPCKGYEDASQASQLEREEHNGEHDKEDEDHLFLKVHRHVYKAQYL